MPEIVERPIVQHVPSEDVDTTLRSRMNKSTISSNHIVYLQETKYNVNDPQMFSQTMSWRE